MALIQCPHCGNSISDKALRCPKCGGPVGEQTHQMPSYNAGAYPVDNMNSSNKGKKTAIIVISAIAAVLAIVVVALLIYINKRPSYSPDTYEDDYFNEVVEESNADPVETSDQTLATIIRYANQDLPEEIDEGMTMTEITLEGDYITYHCSVDEDLYSISDIRSAQSEIKQEMKAFLFGTDDNDIDDFKTICKSNNKGIAFKYEGLQSGRSHTIYIRPSEI